MGVGGDSPRRRDTLGMTTELGVPDRTTQPVETSAPGGDEDLSRLERRQRFRRSLPARFRRTSRGQPQTTASTSKERTVPGNPDVPLEGDLLAPG